jgi:choline kinase
MSATRAIILSAGQGKRLLPWTETRPKCLIDLNGRTLLGWQLNRLCAAGVEEAVVVTGFNAALVEAEIARLDLPGMAVRTQFNPFYQVADNLASVWIARAEFDREVLLLNGDSVIEQAIVERLLAAPPAEITVTIDRKTSYDSDDMKVATHGDRLMAIGKTIEVYDAESIGFLRFSAEGARRFVAAADRLLRSPEGLGRWYLSVINDLAQGEMNVRVQSIEGLDWGEMDFPQDLDFNLAMTRRWVEREGR